MSGGNSGSGGSAATAPDPPTATGTLSADQVLRSILGTVAESTIGYEWVVRLLYVALLTEGHVLLEGTPGIAKTQLVRRFAGSLGLSFKRIQFTPDMLPSDITGNVVLNPASRLFEFHEGPVFTNVLLADEINRAPPKVQSALLESMQEHQVTIDGVSHPLPRPFMVIATQNPIEQEGTYPLPEAQLDRILFRILLDYPSEVDERTVIRRALTETADSRPQRIADGAAIGAHRRQVEGVYLSEEMIEYVTRLVRATREDPRIVVGGSPRSAVQLARAAKAHALLDGRAYASPEDVKELAFWVLNHRIALDPDLLSDEASEGGRGLPAAHKVLAEIFDQVPVPG
jgi:MoxR-like ATPase